MELGLDLKQTQTLSPQMMQAMEILQMGSQELLEYIQEAVQENPVLETEDARQPQESPEDALLRRKLEWLASTDVQNRWYHQERFAVFRKLPIAPVTRLGHRVAHGGGFADMGLGQLFQAVFILPVGKGSVQNVNDVQLGDTGGHGPAAEGGLIGGSVELVVGQLRHRRRHAAGDGNDGSAVFTHGLHALNDLHRLPRIRDGDA